MSTTSTTTPQHDPSSSHPHISSPDDPTSNPLPTDPSPPAGTILIPRRSGAAFTIKAGQTLTVVDPLGGQVSDLLAYNLHDTREVISAGRTIDYASRIYLTTPDPLYSNRSNVMLTITHDTVGKHDFLLTPCSAEMFRIIYGHDKPHRGCFGNLAAALQPWGIQPDAIPTAFNCFMNVPVDGKSGEVQVLPPSTKPGDSVSFRAEMDLLMGLTACSAGMSNGGTYKPIWFKVE